MVCSGGPQHIGDGYWCMPGPDRRGQTTFGAFGITHLDKLTEPAFEGWQVGRDVGQWVDCEAGRLPSAIPPDGGQAGIEGTGPIVSVQVGHQVHDCADSLTGTPALLTIARPIVQPKGKGRSGRFLVTLVHQGEHALGDHQADIALQSILQSLALPFSAVAGRGDIYPDVALLNLHRKATHIVSPEVERTATRQVEAGMMPVAGQDAIVDGAFVQGETHMRTAVINGVYLATVLEKRYHIMPGQHG
jgi:hypothetical protein